MRIIFKSSTAIFAEACFRLVAGASAVGASLVDADILSAYKFCRDDARRNGKYGISQQHYDCGKESAQRSDRRDVSVAYGRKRYYGPVYAVRQVVELTPGLTALDHKHQGSEADDKYYHEGEKDSYLAPARYYGPNEYVAFCQEVKQLQDSEHPNQSQDSEHNCVLNLGKDEPKIHRQNCKQVNYAEKTENVIFRVAGTIDAQDVFNGKERCKEVFEIKLL